LGGDVVQTKIAMIDVEADKLAHDADVFEPAMG
jgi:hypothetical protein